MGLLGNRLKQLKYGYAISSLKRRDPAVLEQTSQEKAVEAFKKSSHIPVYKDILEKNHVAPASVNDLASFKKNVPIINKHSIFRPYRGNLLDKSTLQNIQDILLSSGASGTFSFGLSNENKNKNNTEFLEALFNDNYQILKRRTLIINCFGQIKLPSLYATVLQTGPRADALLYALKNLSPAFDQTIIIADNYFIKNSLEEGLNEKLDYSKLKIHLIIGGVYLPENLRAHLAKILHIDFNQFETGSIISSMGISEFGLNLFFSSQETVRLRRLAQNNPELRRLLCDANLPPYLPMFFNYFPQLIFLEEINQDLVITNLDTSSQLPLIRYNSQDKGKIIPYNELKNILESLNIKGDYLPRFRSPLVLIYGKDSHIETPNGPLYPAQIQEALYSEFDIGSKTTGYFRLNSENNGKEVKLEIQLKRGLLADEYLTARFKQILHNHIPLKPNLNLKLYAYQNFPYGMELDYERKFKYI